MYVHARRSGEESEGLLVALCCVLAVVMSGDDDDLDHTSIFGVVPGVDDNVDYILDNILDLPGFGPEDNQCEPFRCGRQDGVIVSFANPLGPLGPPEDLQKMTDAAGANGAGATSSSPEQCGPVARAPLVETQPALKRQRLPEASAAGMTPLPLGHESNDAVAAPGPGGATSARSVTAPGTDQGVGRPAGANGDGGGSCTGTWTSINNHPIGLTGLALLVALARGEAELCVGENGAAVLEPDRKNWIKVARTEDGREEPAILISTKVEDLGKTRADLIASYVHKTASQTHLKKHAGRAQSNNQGALATSRKAAAEGGGWNWSNLNNAWFNKGLLKFKETLGLARVPRGGEDKDWKRLNIDQRMFDYCRALNRDEALGPDAVQQQLSTVYSAVKAKLDTMSKDVPYCKVLLLLNEQDFLAVAEKEHKYVQQQHEARCRDSNLDLPPSKSLADAFDSQHEGEAKAAFLLKVVQDYEKQWRASLVKAAESNPKFSVEAIHNELATTSEDYRNATERHTKKWHVAGLRAEMLNARGFDDCTLEGEFTGKFLEAGCVILHMEYRPSTIEPQRLIALVRRNSLLFPWLAAVAVRNSDDAICAVHVLKNIAQDTHSDFVRRHIQKPLVVGDGCMFKVKRRKKGSHGEFVDCAVQHLDGMRCLGPPGTWVGQDAATESQVAIVDALQHRHRHVAQHYHHEKYCHRIYTEWCDVSLFSWMICTPAPDFYQRLQVCGNICNAVRHLHELGVAHRAIGPNSIMFRRRTDGGMEPVLTNFGSAFKSEQMTSGDVTALADLILGIFIDHQRHHKIDGWAIRYSDKDTIMPFLCKMEQYQLEELCDILSLIHQDGRDQDMEHHNLPVVTVRVLLQHPIFNWRGPNGLNERVQWIDANKGNLRDITMLSLETFKDWTSHADLRPPPCSQLGVTLRHATEQGLMELICHCARFPDTDRLNLPMDKAGTAEVNDAVARFFLRLFPTLFVGLFRDLLNQSGASEGDITEPWEMSPLQEKNRQCEDERDEIEHECPGSPSNTMNPSRPDDRPGSPSNGMIPSRRDGEGDICDDDPHVAIPRAPGDDSSASGVDPTSAHEGEQARRRDRAKHRRLASETAPQCSV